MIPPRQAEILYNALARVAGLALVLLTVSFQRRDSMHWTEFVFLGLCIGLQETFLRLAFLKKFRSTMLVLYSLLPLGLIAARAPDIMQHKGELVPLILHTPLPLVFVSIQIMVLYLREAPRLTSVVLVLALFSTVIGLRRNVGDPVWPWLAGICCCASAYLMLQNPGTLLARLTHALSGRTTTQSLAARPFTALRPAFWIALSAVVFGVVVLALLLFVALPRPDLRGAREVIAGPPPPAPPPTSSPDRNPGTPPGTPDSGPDVSVSGLSSGVDLGVFGRIQLDTRPAMQVRPVNPAAAHRGPLYLRAFTFATFDGRRWLPLPDESSARVEVPEGDRRALSESPLNGPRRVQRSYEVTLSEGAAGQKGELPLPVIPLALSGVTGPISTSAADGSTRAPMQANDMPWIVHVSELAETTDMPPRRTDTSSIPAEYSRTPPELPALLAERYEFFRDLSPANGGPVAAARRIVENFREKRGADGLKLWRYSLTERPTGRNSIVRFLDTRTERAQRYGHCEYFASAMVLLLRCHGVPARLCAGFRGAVVDGNGVYQLTFADAHAWVEVWAPPYGWLAFDPTPPAEPDPAATQPVANPETPDAQAPDTVEAQPESRPEDEPDWFSNFGADKQGQWIEDLGESISRMMAGIEHWLAGATAWLPGFLPQNPWARAALILLPPLALIWLLTRRSRRHRKQVSEILGAAGNNGRARERGLYAELLLLLSQHGHRKHAHETPLEFALRVAQTTPVHAPLPDLTRLYYDFRFGLREAQVAEFRKGLTVYAARLRAGPPEPAGA